MDVITYLEAILKTSVAQEAEKIGNIMILMIKIKKTNLETFYKK